MYQINSLNIEEIFNSKELKEDSTVKIIRIVDTEGNRKVDKDVEFYSLDAIIAVGYRANSYEDIQFRICLANNLKEYIRKFFIINEKNNNIMIVLSD